MKIYKFIIKINSNFITPLKGDTLFGSIVWNLNYLDGINLNDLFKNYLEDPFLIVSSAFPCIKKNQHWEFFLKKPSIPISLLNKNLDAKERKKIKSRNWFSFKNEENIHLNSFEELLDDKEFIDKYRINTLLNKIFYKTKEYHNSIHRIKNSTLSEDIESGFSPFDEIIYSLPEDIYLYFYIAIREDLSQEIFEKIKKAIQILGEFGFGKKASSGKGKFQIIEEHIINIEKSSNQYYTLSPFLFKEKERNFIEKYYYESFVRFGKSHFSYQFIKKPVLLMDDGSVLFLKEEKNLYYIGTGIQFNQNSYQQAYSILLPIKIKLE